MYQQQLLQRIMSESLNGYAVKALNINVFQSGGFTNDVTFGEMLFSMRQD